MKNIYKKQIEQIIESIQLEYDVKMPKHEFVEALTNALYINFYINEKPCKVNITQKAFSNAFEQIEKQWITDFKTDPNYYFFYGQKDINQETEMGRFYISARVENCKDLVCILMTSLVNAGIAFSMKCHKTIKEYERADNLVLYFEQRNYWKVLRLVKKLGLENPTFLKNYGPLFTKEILPGIYYAQDPGIINESFGTVRCRLIAEGIWECVSQNILQKNWSRNIFKYFKTQNYNLDFLYLNPNYKPKTFFIVINSDEQNKN
jgi:HopA1 effector protein family